VDDVLAGEDEADVAVHGDVQFIDFFQAVGLLGLPHPLFADDVNIQGVLRGMAIIDINDGAPAEHGQGQNERNDHPSGFEAGVTFEGNSDVIGFFCGGI